jgi:AbrB family looped-hinge helix DNA binding protein
MGREIAIDTSGRLVIPKDVRARHRLNPGTRLWLEEEGDRLVLVPAPEAPLTVEESGLLVFRGRLTGEIPDHRELRLERLDALASRR